MRNELKRSWPSRLVAASFILLILLGNIWFVDRLTGQEPAFWQQLAFILGAFGVLVGGLSLGVLALSRRGRVEELIAEELEP